MQKFKSMRFQGVPGVILCGFIGGLLIWLIGIRNKDEIKVHQIADPIISSILGGTASLIFVYLISNTDRSDNNRLMTLALLSGLCWEPVLEAGTVFIDHNNQEFQSRKITRIFEEITSELNSLPESNTEEREIIISKLNSNLKNIKPLINKIDNISIREEAIQSKDVLEKELTNLPENEKYLLSSTLRQSLGSNSDLEVLIPYEGQYLASLNPNIELRGFLNPNIELRDTKSSLNDSKLLTLKIQKGTKFPIQINNLDPNQLNIIFDSLPKVKNTTEPVSINNATSIKKWRAICLGENEKGLCPRSASHEFWSHVGENSKIKIKESRGWLLYKYSD